jgi:HD-GYP domain-containing protein (c-di-GMP phosphodiesterase class II)
VASLYQQGQESTRHSAVEIAQAIEKVADYFAQGHKELHDLCSLDYPTDESFLFRHAANVSIFCVSLGFALGLDRVCLIELGSAAAVHDIGMMQFRDIFTQTRTLTKEEYAKIKQHPDKGFETLARIAKGFSPIVCDAMRQEHERMDASGYPKGLKGEQIHAYGQIMGLVDVYEALLHRRPWRKRHTPMEAIKLLLEHKGAFAPHVLKALIEHIGIFPVGMPVRLSTKEIGVIVRGNPKFPLRPVVDIIVDAYGSELASPRPIDLAANSMVYIEECLERGDS